MCGIAGIINRTPAAPDREILEAMLCRIQHRGPDAVGYWSRGPVGLAHARLSIIDLASGQQPMSDSDGHLWITFNGEIFNYVELRNELIAAGHRFSTTSDTEVILHMYAEKGEHCVEHFNGQWAFAIWDSRRKTLFLSRDRLGVRPLFYTETPGSFVFASEIKSLLAHPEVGCSIDLQALDEVFTFWSNLPPKTMFKGIRQLPPGHSMTIENGRIRVWPYWQLDYSAVDLSLNEEDCAGRVLELLSDATRIRLRADVPVGAYLSGGLDSSIISALTKQVSGSRFSTFSVNFEDAEFDERQYQEDVVRLLDTKHRAIRCSVQDICDVFPKVVWHAETPLLRTAPAPLYILSDLVHGAGYKVVLTGEGADEFFGGYDIFKEAKIRSFWAADLNSRLRPLLLKRLYPYLPNLQAQSDEYLKSFFQVNPRDFQRWSFSHLPRWTLTEKVKLFLSEEVKSQLQSCDAYAEMEGKLSDAFARWDRLSQAQFLEVASLLQGYLLSSQGDRMAMAHSVEGRYPFLDYRLVEFTTKIPAQLKMKVLNEKYILKRAAGHLVPSSVRLRSKQPYRAPDACSFFDPSSGRARSEYVEELLCGENLRRDDLFNASAVAKLVDKARRGQLIGAKDNMALVGIISTQLLVEQFMNKRGVQSNVLN